MSSVPGNAARILLDTAVSEGDREAVIESEGATSYSSLADRALAFAEALSGVGVRPGDRVALLLRRGADSVAAFYGTLATGGVAVIVNELLRPRQIEHILSHSGARVLVSDPGVTDRLQGPIETSAVTVELGDIPGSGSFAPTSRVADDVGQIIYTSGSTGLPKGVTISHANLWVGMRSVVTYLGIARGDRIASLLPFSFDYGLNQLLCSAGTGAALVVERSSVPQRIVQALRRSEVTVLGAVPPLWLQLLGVESFRDEALPSLRVMTNTGGRLPTEAVRQLRNAQPRADLVLMYGLTEAFRSTYLAPQKADSKPGSIGDAIPGAEIMVLNEDLEPCAPGKTGQLVHRGPTVALGYWDDPEATERVYRPNPLRPRGTPEAERVVFSGDLVYRDEDGDLFFVGREDAMIKTLGYRISPDEVAEVLYASGEVLEAVVAAEPDEERGSLIVAYVVLTENGDQQRLESFVASELPRYMQPARYEIRSELPRTASGKHDARAAARGPDDPA